MKSIKMNSKIKIVVEILIMGVILVGGWWILNSQTIEGPRGTCGQKAMGSNYDVSYCDKLCNMDNDCKFTCGCGAINKNEICHDEGIIYDCVDHNVKCKDSRCVIGKEILPEEVSIITDKTEYQQGEKITATLNYKSEIYQWDRYGWSIQKWENGSWITIQRKEDPYFFCANTHGCKAVSSEEIEECPPIVLCEAPCWYHVQDTPKLMWDQLYKIGEKTFQCNFIQRTLGKVTSEEVVNRTCAIFKQAPQGEYKVRFEYKSTLDPNNQCSRNVDVKYVEKEIVIK